MSLLAYMFISRPIRREYTGHNSSTVASLSCARSSGFLSCLTRPDTLGPSVPNVDKKGRRPVGTAAEDRSLNRRSESGLLRIHLKNRQRNLVCETVRRNPKADDNSLPFFRWHTSLRGCQEYRTTIYSSIASMVRG